MSTGTTKTDTIKSDKMKFRTQIVDGKPQIFFDPIDGAPKSKGKRNSRSNNQTQSFRLNEEQKSRMTNQRNSNDQRPPASMSRPPQSNGKVPVKDDGSNLGVYMTMDELAELVKAVKENAKTDNQTNMTIKEPAPVHPVPNPPRLYEPPPVPSSVPKLDLPAAAASTVNSTGHISPREQTLSIMAEKKRQKWQRERAEVERLQMEIEYDQLKHQLSPRHKKNSVSPERSTFQYDFPANGKPPVPPPAPVLPPALRLNDNSVEASTRMPEDYAHEQLKTRLIERKQQQWKQENADKMPDWNPFGRPGGGAPNPNEITARPTPAPVVSNPPYRPPLPPPKVDPQPSVVPPASYVHNDQSRVPAAMRTNLMFGDVRFEDDIKNAKEIERRQWLEDLQKQIEENKRKKFLPAETERRKDFLHENVQPLIQEAANRHNPQFKQGQDVARNIDSKSTVPPANQTSGEKLFGPNYDSSSKPNLTQQVDGLNLNGGFDRKHQYRAIDERRDEAVNTVGATFRSDQTHSNDYRTSPSKQQHGHAHEDSDLPPYASNPSHQRMKRNSRMRTNEEQTQSRRISATTYQTNENEDGYMSQANGSRPADMNHRPLWNYKNPAHRQYVPNSKRDPHYERRQRMKHFEQGNFERIDDVQKKTCYNRWNSDSEIQQRQKRSQPKSRIRSTNSKPTGLGHRKDESILNLLKGQNRLNDLYVGRKPSSIPMRNDDDYQSNRASSPDKDENLSIYQPADERQDPSPRSHSRDSSPQKPMVESQPYEESQQRLWDNTSRADPYPQPISRQEHILQQLSTIRENLVRRQRELAT